MAPIGSKGDEYTVTMYNKGFDCNYPHGENVNT